MKLYLSSFRMGERFDDLVSVLGPGAKVAVVSNALDYIPADARRAYARTGFDALRVFIERGLDAVDLDLRSHFDAPRTLEDALADVRLVWAVGGNAFLLRRAMRQSGFDRWLPSRVQEGTLIYGGWSAGAVVAGPDLDGIELMDDPAMTAEGYETAVVREGLGLVDFTVVPHYRSDHPEAGAAERAAAFRQERRLPLRTLRDGEVIVV
jgi:dipeptidase E